MTWLLVYGLLALVAVGVVALAVSIDRVGM